MASIATTGSGFGNEVIITGNVASMPPVPKLPTASRFTEEVRDINDNGNGNGNGNAERNAKKKV
jgi:hypothetical protein